MKKILIKLLILSSCFISSSAFPAVGFNEIAGKWKLMYKNNCGYEFLFQKNYRAYCILYSGTNALIFKGIYSIEGDKIRININEMKNEEKVSSIDLRNRFIKTSSSYFIFQVEFPAEKNSNKTLILKSLKTVIDGNDSDGYFEPEVSLRKY